jgi:hypothetical protein
MEFHEIYEIWYLGIFLESVENIHVRSYLAHFFLEWEMFQSCRENQNTHFVFRNYFFRKSWRLWDNVKKNTVERGRPQVTLRRMRCTFCLPKATDTHSENVLTGFPR